MHPNSISTQVELRLITESDITPVVFDKLHSEHKKTLSCPCSKVTILYDTFIETLDEFHPICSSAFISKEWIEALYLKHASRYGTGDFRTAASSQFRLLANLCSYSKSTVHQSRSELKNENLISHVLLTKDQVKDKVHVMFQSVQNSAIHRMISFLDYIRATVRANSLVSALNTNYLIIVNDIPQDPIIISREISLIESSMSGGIVYTQSNCFSANAIERATFLSLNRLTSANPFCPQQRRITKMLTKTVSKPPLIDYERLQIEHFDTLRCPCSTMIIPYKNFISLSPILHQVCSSDFVSDRWFTLLGNIRSGYNTLDWRNRALSQFRLLADICQLANRTIDDAVNRFRFQSFSASIVLTKNAFEKQIDVILELLFQSTTDYFSLLLETTRILMQVDQLYMGSIRTTEIRAKEENPEGIFTRNNTLRVKFRLTGPRNVDAKVSNCICAIDSNCQYPVGIYDVDHVLLSHPTSHNLYTTEGLIAGCTITDSLMFSTLECYYSNSTCLSILMNYSRQSYFLNVLNPSSWFDVRPLVYNSTLSRFPPQTLISTIVKKLMIEQWSQSVSYENFYQSCAPDYCTYSQRQRIRSTLNVLVKFLSIVSGIVLSLRLIVPQLIEWIVHVIRKVRKTKQQQQQQQARQNSTVYDRLRQLIQNRLKYMRTILTELNVFYRRDFSSNIDQRTAKYLGQWATRLFLILFSVALIILSLYTMVVSRTVTTIYTKPDLNMYTDLFQRYGSELKCPCSSIAFPYKDFIRVKARFHEVCSSSFVLDEGRLNLTSGFVSNLSFYRQKDYRRFFSAHLQFLQGLCQLSEKATNISIQTFLLTLFAGAELQSKVNLDPYLYSIIEQSRLNAPKTFLRHFVLLEDINHANAFISMYGTNYEYYAPWTNLMHSYLPTKALDYDNCSCGMFSNCTSEGRFFEENSSNTFPIQGLKIGCTPSESFRVSTLECFYNQSCLDLIQQYTSKTNSICSLSNTTSRFPTNRTIDELLRELFVEEWQTTVDYSSWSGNNSQMDLSESLILYSIKVSRQEISLITTLTSSLASTSTSTSIETQLSTDPMTTSTIISTTTTKSACQLKFERISTSRDESFTITSHVIADFNGDGYVDLAFLGENSDDFYVMIGYGLIAEQQPIVIADINGDQHLDIGFGYIDNQMKALVGDGHRNFELQTVFKSRFSGQSTWIGVADLDNDKDVDMIEIDLSTESQDVLLNTCH
ncbi:hypothetical protein I4U23_016617 [Adineta vaga]|nr:hypothetical protein I4U23_016617 [Adineta vaga]